MTLLRHYFSFCLEVLRKISARKAGALAENRTEHSPSHNAMASSSCSSPGTKNKGIEIELGQNWAAPARGYSGSVTTLNIHKNANNFEVPKTTLSELCEVMLFFFRSRRIMSFMFSVDRISMRAAVICSVGRL
jgi:hypothetical protein